MKRISHSTYLELLAAAKVIERDASGEKVVALPGGELVKIFRRKRWLTSAMLFPYARRFVRNARRLTERAISTVTVLDSAYCPAVGRHLVTYRPLPGVTVRNELKNRMTDPALLLAVVARFTAALHQKGIYFRSLHFGNIIVAPEQLELGLIDVADMSIRHQPLGANLRARNFGHMLRNREDAGYLREFGGDRFIEIYLEAAHLSPRCRRHFLELLHKSPELLLLAATCPEG